MPNPSGHKSVMVPSQVAGLCAAHERYGSLPLTEVMAPAITLAEEGVPVDRTMMKYIVDSAALLRRFPATAAVFLKDGLSLRAGSAPWNPGDILVRKDLAQTLRRIASGGPRRVLSRRNRPGHRRRHGRQRRPANTGGLANYGSYIYPAPAVHLSRV